MGIPARCSGTGRLGSRDSFPSRCNDASLNHNNNKSRSSERLFYQKILDIYATSVDYTPNTELSQQFFATVQNKMHWAAHGHTAAEIVHQRADAAQPNMGLTAWLGGKPRKTDVAIAKNYLSDDELAILNRFVMAYLEFAEIQALGRRAMYMTDWIAKLDEFLRLSDREVLRNPGSISHEQAVARAEAEFEKYRQALLDEASAVERHFEAAVRTIKQLERNRPPRPSRTRRTTSTCRPRRT